MSSVVRYFKTSQSYMFLDSLSSTKRSLRTRQNCTDVVKIKSLFKKRLVYCCKEHWCRHRMGFHYKRNLKICCMMPCSIFKDFSVYKIYTYSYCKSCNINNKHVLKIYFNFFHFSIYLRIILVVYPIL